MVVGIVHLPEALSFVFSHTLGMALKVFSGALLLWWKTNPVLTPRARSALYHPRPLLVPFDIQGSTGCGREHSQKEREARRREEGGRNTLHDQHHSSIRFPEPPKAREQHRPPVSNVIALGTPVLVGLFKTEDEAARTASSPERSVRQLSSFLITTREGLEWGVSSSLGHALVTRTNVVA